MATLKSRIGRWILPLLPVNRRTVESLRHELRALQTRFRNWLSPSHRATVARLRREGDLQVNLGSGGQGLPGWVNVELTRHKDTVLTLDIRKPLPFAEASVARIFAEHVIEHVDFRNDLVNMLTDWRRVLKPGGVARVIVPDAPRYMAAYLSNDLAQWQALGWDTREMPDDIYTPMHIVNHTFHQDGEHLFGYDFETLKWAFQKAGFGCRPGRISQVGGCRSGDRLARPCALLALRGRGEVRRPGAAPSKTDRDRLECVEFEFRQGRLDQDAKTKPVFWGEDWWTRQGSNL